MKYTQNQTCALGSSPATAPRAATSGHYFEMTTGALIPAAIAPNSQQEQQQQFFSRLLAKLFFEQSEKVKCIIFFRNFLVRSHFSGVSESGHTAAHHSWFSLVFQIFSGHLKMIYPKGGKDSNYRGENWFHSAEKWLSRYVLNALERVTRCLQVLLSKRE